MKIIQKAVVMNGGKYLVLLRSARALFFPEHWDFPGGKLEKGENPFLGVEREIFEEIGVRIKTTRVVGIYEMVIANDALRFVIYETIPLEKWGITLSPEHSAFRWVARDELLTLRVEPYVLKYLEEHP